jgi:hypothetical protein
MDLYHRVLDRVDLVAIELVWIPLDFQMSNLVLRQLDKDAVIALGKRHIDTESVAA